MGISKGICFTLTLGQKQSLESVPHLHSPKVTSYLFNPTATLPCSYFNLKLFHSRFVVETAGLVGRARSEGTEGM